MTINEAFTRKTALKEEMNNLQGMGCLNIVNKSQQKQVVFSKGVLKQKMNDEGALSKYKARFVACENEDSSSNEECFHH